MHLINRFMGESKGYYRQADNLLISMRQSAISFVFTIVRAQRI